MEIKFNLAIFTSLGIITALILILNMMAIMVIISTKKLRNVTGFLMVSLAFADMCVGVTSIIPLVYAIFTDLLTHTACQIMGFTNSVCLIVSILTLVLLTIDRFLAIGYPLKYPNWVNNKNCMLAVTLTWLFSILIWILPLFGIGSYTFNDEEVACYFDVGKHPNQWIVYMAVIFIPASVIIFVCNGRLYIISKKHKNQIDSLVLSSKKSTTKLNYKALRTTVIIVGVFYITWTPFIVEHIVKGTSEPIPEWLEILIYMLSISNSFCNPIIYVLTNSLFRVSARNKLCFCCKSLKSQVGDYDNRSRAHSAMQNNVTGIKTGKLPAICQTVIQQDIDIQLHQSRLI